MNNPDMPAMPSKVTYEKHVITTNARTGSREDLGMQKVTESMVGLSKREHFAGLAMQGLAARNLDYGQPTWVEDTANMATDLADALLKELDK
jgi:methyl coenzyme M reductase beta subunit